MSKIKELIFTNSSNKQIIFKNTFWMGMLEFLSKIIMFFVTIWLVRYLGPSLFGKYNIAISLVAIFMIFSDLGVGYTMTRDIARDKNVSDKYISNAFGIRIFTTIFIIILSLLSSYFLKYDSELLLIFLLAVVHNSALQFQGLVNNVLSAHEKMEYIFVTRITYYLGLLLSTLFAITYKISLTTLLSIYCSITIISIILSIYLLSHIKVTIRISFDFKFWKKIITASLPIFGYVACSQIYSNIDTLLIGKFYNNESVGMYQAAYKILFAFHSINLINSVMFPRITKLISEKKLDALRKITIYIITLSIIFLLIFFILIVLFSKEIILLIYGSQYLTASPVLVFLILAGSINYFRIMATNFLMARNKQNIIFYTMVIGLVVNSVLNILLLPAFGITFSAISLLMSEFIMLIVSCFSLLFKSSVRSKS